MRTETNPQGKEHISAGWGCWCCREGMAERANAKGGQGGTGEEETEHIGDESGVNGATRTKEKEGKEGRGERRRRTRAGRQWGQEEIQMLEEHDRREEIPLATLKHVLGGECNGLPRVERETYMNKVAKALEKARATMKGKYEGTCTCHTMIARAYAGAKAMTRGEEMDEGKWLALQRFGAGVLPKWTARSYKDKKAAKEIICSIIRQVQTYMHEMLQAWRARAQGGIAFQVRLQEKRGWLQLVLRS